MDSKQFQAKCYNLKSKLDVYVALVKDETLSPEQACEKVINDVGNEFIAKIPV